MPWCRFCFFSLFIFIFVFIANRNIHNHYAYEYACILMRVAWIWSIFSVMAYKLWSTWWRRMHENEIEIDYWFSLRLVHGILSYQRVCVFVCSMFVCIRRFFIWWKYIFIFIQSSIFNANIICVHIYNRLFKCQQGHIFI